MVGQEPTDALVDGMMSEAPGPLNFTMFLTLFGEKLTGEHGNGVVQGGVVQGGVICRGHR